MHCARDDGGETSKLPGKSCCRRGNGLSLQRNRLSWLRHACPAPRQLPFPFRCQNRPRAQSSSQLPDGLCRQPIDSSANLHQLRSGTNPRPIRQHSTSHLRKKEFPRNPTSKRLSTSRNRLIPQDSPPPPAALIHAPSSMPRANTPAPPIPQLIPTRRLAGSPSRPPGRTPGAQAPDSPSSQTTPIKETREPPENPTLGTPLHETVHAPTSLLHTGPPSTPPPQFTPARRLASSPSGLPGRTPRVPAKPDVPSAAPPAPSPDSASRERLTRTVGSGCPALPSYFD